MISKFYRKAIRNGGDAAIQTIQQQSPNDYHVPVAAKLNGRGCLQTKVTYPEGKTDPLSRSHNTFRTIYMTNTFGTFHQPLVH